MRILRERVCLLEISFHDMSLFYFEAKVSSVDAVCRVEEY